MGCRVAALLAMTFTAVLSSLVSSLSSNMVTSVNEKSFLFFVFVAEDFYFIAVWKQEKIA